MYTQKDILFRIEKETKKEILHRIFSDLMDTFGQSYGLCKKKFHRKQFIIQNIEYSNTIKFLDSINKNFLGLKCFDFYDYCLNSKNASKILNLKTKKNNKISWKK